MIFNFISIKQTYKVFKNLIGLSQKMQQTLRNTLLFILTFSYQFGYAQKEAIIIGKIDNPPSPNVFIEYHKNLFTLEPGTYEASVDLNNLFGIRVNLTEPRTLIFKYQNDKIRLFLAPGDTLKMVFDGKSMLQTLIFEGKNAAANRYLLSVSKRFNDFIDENALDYSKFQGKTANFLKYIDTSYIAKNIFFDTYDPSVKTAFTKSFLDFAATDFTYWRAFHLLNYYKTSNLNQSKAFIDKPNNYFDFLKETDLNNAKALNNVFYLKFLNLYLAYFHEKNADKIGALPPDAIEEKQRMVQVVKPRADQLQVWENPLSTRNVVATLSLSDEAFSQYLTTNEAISFRIKDITIYDYFIKIKTQDGKFGWVPQTSVSSSEKQIIEKQILPRFCFDTGDSLCRFDIILQGKVLYFAALRDILSSTGQISMDSMRLRTEAFLQKNNTFKEYNDILRGVFKSVETDRENRMERLQIPTDCMVEYFNLNKLFFDKNLSAHFGNKVEESQPMSMVANPINALESSENGQSPLTYQVGKPYVFKGLAINENVPPFKLTDVNGKDIRQQDLLGKIVYIDFWATWCSPCQSQLTHSQGLMEKYKDNKNIVFLYISTDTDLDAWKTYLKDNKMKGLQTNDANLVALNFMIQGLPNYFIIDKNGRVAYNSRISSKIDAESMIEFLLK